MDEKPELSDGYGKIANEIIEALAFVSMSSYESQCLWFIFRKTYGWKKKEDWVSLSQFVEGTGISKPHVCRALRLLLQKNIITKRGNDSLPKGAMMIGFNKYHSQWRALPKGANAHKSLPKGAMTVARKGNLPLPEGAPTKETITKETITKEYSANAPALYSQRFFNKELEAMTDEANYFLSKGIPIEIIREEFAKFCNYWTEKTQGGKKTRWETEKTFEVRRRLHTWLSRTLETYKKKSGSLNMPDFRS